MKKFFIVLFVGMGVLFLFQLIALAYLFVVDPYNLKPILFPESRAIVSPRVDDDVSSGQSVESNPSATSDAGTTAESSGVTAAQAEALTSVGLDASAAQSFTPEQISCFEGLLGATRVSEIKAGAVPTMAEFYTVRSCM
jgi:hypothetical protein